MSLNIQSTNQAAAANAIKKTIDGLNISAEQKAQLASQVAKLSKQPDVIDKLLRNTIATGGTAGGAIGETLLAAGIGTSLVVGGKEILNQMPNHINAIRDNFAGVKNSADAAKGIWDSIPQAAFVAGEAGVIAILGIVAAKAGVEYKDMVKAEWASRHPAT